MKYNYYREDLFGQFVGYMVPFFTVIAYMCPLCLYVLRFVTDKETKVKEGMKIMGLNESIYFLSYFIQFIFINIIHSIINGIIIFLVFDKVPLLMFIITFFLWGMCIFSLVYFIQSFIDKVRIALIITLLVYFIMFFMSMAVMNRAVKKPLKILMSVFPPVALELGVILFGNFQASFKKLKWEHINTTYFNYSMICI